MEKPLAGAVLCCTSVAPELRSQYADYALQMGAEHKLDLTSDVTHLLVGDSNTPKYKYVAREREDVRVLKPEWIEAVRQKWMNDEKIDLNLLEAEYKYPALTALNVCITGFDDLAFRAKLQEAVVANGGTYTGDLTKAVTHLIAGSPSGKKWEFATKWGIRIVSLKWLKDSLDRGMQLAESSYALSVPAEEQGKGAWNREAKNQQLGKRDRANPPAPEPPRKLRRTASARLSSQTNDLWGDIVPSGPTEAPASNMRQPLRPSKSMPVIGPVQDVQEADSFAMNAGHQQPRVAAIGHGFLDDRYFHIHGFNTKHEDKLREVLISHGAVVLDSVEELDDSTFPANNSFLLVPHQSSAQEVLSVSPTVPVVTELWIEWCMAQHAFYRPDQYPLGKPLTGAPWDSFREVIVNTTGLPQMMVLHISKLVKLMGGQYSEVFHPQVSVLVSNAIPASQDKLVRAREWGIAMVSVKWLVSCIRACRLEPFDKFLLEPVKKTGRNGIEVVAEAGVREQQRKPTTEELCDNKRPEEARLEVRDEPFDKAPTKATTGHQGRQGLAEIYKPGSDFYEQAEDAAQPEQNQPKLRPNEDCAVILPLQEIPSNSPPKPKPVQPKKRLFQSRDGNASNLESDRGRTQQENSNQIAKEAQTINGAIHELLGRSKSASSSNVETQPKKKLLGRALSSLSNSSRHSRASSIDTVNTDGVGSEIAAETSQSKVRLRARANSTFTGRAKPREPVTKPSSVQLGDPGLCQDEYVDEEQEAMQLTQLGYEDPEEVIALRKKLAEKRRKKSRQGQEGQNQDEDEEQHTPSSSGRPTADAVVPLRKTIVDDDVHGERNWGAGRRTRKKESPRVKGF